MTQAHQNPSAAIGEGPDAASMSFVRVGVENIDLLRSVADDVFDYEIDFGFAKAFLAEPRNILAVACAGGRVVGQIVAVVHRHLDVPADLYIDNLGVAPAWQRRGVARRLVAMAFEAGAEQGAVAAWVAAETDNAPANALYKTAGATRGQFAMFSFADLRLRGRPKA